MKGEDRMKGTQLICSVIQTLEQVEVHGSGNMDRLLGCIQALGKLEQEMRRNEQSENDAVQQRDPEGAASTV